MKNPIESINHFCLIQLEIVKTREMRLRKEIEDCKIQREFLSQLLVDIGNLKGSPDDIISNLINTMRKPEK